MTAPESFELDPVQPWTSEHLGMEVAHLGFTITRLDQLVMEADKGNWSRDVLAHALKEMREQTNYLKDVMHSLERLIGDGMSQYRETIDGVGTLERHPNKSYTQWNKEELLSDVLDTRMVDPATGEIVDETALDKVLHVWNLGAPRQNALKQRGLDPDEYATVEDKGGYRVVIR